MAPVDREEVARRQIVKQFDPHPKILPVFQSMCRLCFGTQNQRKLAKIDNMKRQIFMVVVNVNRDWNSLLGVGVDNMVV